MKVISKLVLFSILIFFVACATKDSKGNKEEDGINRNADPQ